MIKAKEIRHNVTIDFEKFEVLYLVVGLTDTEQEIGDGFVKGISSSSLLVALETLTWLIPGTVTITIVDLNDNAPQWTPGTLETLRYVREEASTDTVIGNVLATDDDGPDFNQVTYRIE